MLSPLLKTLRGSTLLKTLLRLAELRPLLKSRGARQGTPAENPAKNPAALADPAKNPAKYPDFLNYAVAPC